MQKRKPLEEQGGSTQKANMAQALAAEHGAVDDVVPVPSRRKKHLVAEHNGYATVDNQSAWS